MTESVACPRCNQRAGSRVTKTAIRNAVVYRRRECLGCAFRYSTHESIGGVRRYVKAAPAVVDSLQREAARSVACTGCGTLRGTLAHEIKCRAGICSDSDVPVNNARTTAGKSA